MIFTCIIIHCSMLKPNILKFTTTSFEKKLLPVTTPINTSLQLNKLQMYSSKLCKDSFSTFCYKLNIHQLILPIFRESVKNDKTRLIMQSKSAKSKQTMETNLNDCVTLIHGIKSNNYYEIAL